MVYLTIVVSGFSVNGTFNGISGTILDVVSEIFEPFLGSLMPLVALIWSSTHGTPLFVNKQNQIPFEAQKPKLKQKMVFGRIVQI